MKFTNRKIKSKEILVSDESGNLTGEVFFAKLTDKVDGTNVGVALTAENLNLGNYRDDDTVSFVSRAAGVSAAGSTTQIYTDSDGITWVVPPSGKGEKYSIKPSGDTGGTIGTIQADLNELNTVVTNMGTTVSGLSTSTISIGNTVSTVQTNLSSVSIRVSALENSDSNYATQTSVDNLANENTSLKVTVNELKTEVASQKALIEKLESSNKFVYENAFKIYGRPIKAQEFDDLNITAKDLDEKNITAFEFDQLAIPKLICGKDQNMYELVDPQTNKRSYLQEVINKLYAMIQNATEEN